MRSWHELHVSVCAITMHVTTNLSRYTRLDPNDHVSLASHCSQCVLAARKVCTPDAAGAGQSVGQNTFGPQRLLIFVVTTADNSHCCAFYC